LYIGCLRRQQFLVATLYVGLCRQHFLDATLYFGLRRQHFLMAKLYIGLRRQHFLVATLYIGLRRQHFLVATLYVGLRCQECLVATALLDECEGRGLCGNLFISRLFLQRGCALTALFSNRRLSLPVSLFSLIGECLGLCGGHLHTLLLRLQRTSEAFVFVVLAGKSGLALLSP
jgi:hypothetical protein